MEKTGLVLEGGGLRGVFTAGVCDLFLEKGIHFDNCIGVSAGSCHACSYLSGQHGRAYSVTVDYLDNKDFISMRNLIRTGNLFGPKMIYHEIPEKLYPIDNEAFKKCGTAFYATVTNCITGQAEYKRVNDIIDDVEYVQASSSLPLVSKAVYFDGIPYLDGGIADSIPIKKSIEMGCTKNVVVLTQPNGFIKAQTRALPLIERAYKKYPEMVKAVAQRHIVYNETLQYIYDLEKSGDIFVIRPEFPLNIKTAEKNKDKLKAAYEHGYEVATKLYDRLVVYLEESDAQAG